MKAFLCRDGLTLVEVVVASFILALALSVCLSSFTMAKQASIKADLTMDATHTARQAMEQIQSYAYSDPELALGVHDLTNGRYRVTQTTGFADAKDVDLEVWWFDATTSATQSVALATTIARCLHR